MFFHKTSERFALPKRKLFLLTRRYHAGSYHWSTYTSVPPALVRIRHIQEKRWNYTVIKWKLPPGGLTLVSKSQTVTLALVRGKAN